MPLPALIGLGIGIGGAIGKMISRGRANRELDKLISQNPSYQINPEAQKRLALANTILNARMPGAAQVERNIYANQANRMGQLQRNATDSSQLLALGAAAQGQSNEAFQNLGIQERQDYYNRLQNLTGAQQGMIEEGDKAYQDQLRRFNDLVQIRGAQQANRQATWGDISNLGFGLADFGMSGGFNNIFGSKMPKTLTSNEFNLSAGSRRNMSMPTYNGAGIGPSILTTMPTYTGQALPIPRIGG